MHSLLIDIGDFLSRSGMAPTTFGRAAVGDPRLVHDLRNGRECGPEIRARVYTYIEGSETAVRKCA